MTVRPLLAWVTGGAVTIAGVALVAMSGLPQRMAPETLRLAAAAESGSKLTEQCNARSATAAPCRIGSMAKPSFAVWGDSHAGALGEAFDAIGKRQGRGGLLYPFGGCPGVIDPTTEKILRIDATMCRDRSRLVLDTLLANPAIRDVVLVNYWQTYTADPPALNESLERTLGLLRRGGKRAVIVAGVPAPGFDLPWALALENQFELTLPNAANDFAPSTGLRLAARHNGVPLVDLSPVLCPTRPCPLLLDGHPLFADSNHLSREAVVKLVVPVLVASDAIRPETP